MALQMLVRSDLKSALVDLSHSQVALWSAKTCVKPSQRFSLAIKLINTGNTSITDAEVQVRMSKKVLLMLLYIVHMVV